MRVELNKRVENIEIIIEDYKHDSTVLSVAINALGNAGKGAVITQLHIDWVEIESPDLDKSYHELRQFFGYVAEKSRPFADNSGVVYYIDEWEMEDMLC